MVFFVKNKICAPIVTRSSSLTWATDKTRPDRKNSSKAIKYLDSLKLRNRTDFTARMLAIIWIRMLVKNIPYKTLEMKRNNE